MVGSQHNQAPQHSNHVTRDLVPSLVQSFRTFPCLFFSHKNKKPTWTCSIEWAQRDQIQRRHGPADVSWPYGMWPFHARRKEGGRAHYWKKSRSSEWIEHKSNLQSWTHVQEEQEEDEKCADAAGGWGMQSSVAIHEEPGCSSEQEQSRGATMRRIRDDDLEYKEATELPSLHIYHDNNNTRHQL